MSDVIKLLPDSVANQIAAGEVIQRPASVVKELVENAVDAGADNIKIIIKDAGRTLIQVIDNGCGMSATDARMAFERHSTSKITGADDLFSLRTMGFRGEALASICAVAQVELLTMRKEDELGTRLVINGSKVETQEPTATAPGSNMMVKNLFFNVPARRKFLKKDSVELSNIMHEFERLALVNPSVDLTIIHNDTTLHQLRHGTLKQRIGDLFGKALERQLIPVETETSLVKINGFVGLPENAKRRGALQYLFVNGRNMRHPYFHKAIMHCYEQLIRADEQPSYFVNFEVDPATIDVNIHPTKNEIKFENEQPIWQILVATVRESLGRFNAVPSIDFDSTDRIDIPAFRPDPNVLVPSSGDPTYNPFTQSSGSETSRTGSGATSWQRASRSAVDDWEKLYESFNKSTERRPDTQPMTFASRANSAAGILPDSDSNTANTRNESTMLQVGGRFIVTSSPGGMMVINQHRAHVTVLYERFMSQSGERRPSQKVMFPEIMMLSPTQNVVLREIMPELESAGFELESAGQNSWAINGVPSQNISAPVDLLKSIIDDVVKGTDCTRDRLRHLLSLGMAKSAAMRGDRRMTEAEMEQLVSDLFSCSSPARTPEGLPIVVEIPISEIESRLG